MYGSYFILDPNFFGKNSYFLVKMEPYHFILCKPYTFTRIFDYKFVIDK